MAALALYWEITYHNILPIFLAAGAGLALGRRFVIDIRSLSRVAFYILSPCLVFNSLSHSTLTGGDVARVGLVAVLTTGGVALLAYAAGTALRLERHLLVSLMVAAAFGNAGNFGLAANKFAFGDEALSIAVIYYVFSTICVYTLGVGVASSGKRSWREMLKHGLLLPTTFAVVIAGLLRLAHVAPPEPLDRAINLLSQAAIPVMLTLLGLQIAASRGWDRSRLGLLGLAAAVQLVAAPLIALGIAGLLGVTGVARQAVVLESAMPTAVITTILAVEYDLDTAFISGAVILSTLLSPLTLAPLIAWLQ
ncbi:MAG: AEC family transporter, partial [Burkholderiaceae bacterium]